MLGKLRGYASQVVLPIAKHGQIETISPQFKKAGLVSGFFLCPQTFDPPIVSTPILLVEKERICRLQDRACDCPGKSGSACRVQALGAAGSEPVQAPAVAGQ